MRIACIGGREIPDNVKLLMMDIGKRIVEKGYYVASGNAVGADYAYASGANSVDPTHVILYLPWRTYNEEQIVEGNRVTWEEKPEWAEKARQFHPRFDVLTRGAKSMMVRNAGILSRADKCIAYLNHHKIGGGGTGHGWRIAESMGIPCLDLASIAYPTEKTEEILSFI